MKSFTNKLLATAAVTAILSFAPIANNAHAKGWHADDLWHGFYLGNHMGWAQFDNDLTHLSPAARAGSQVLNGSLGSNDFAGGLQAGINHQIGVLVVGVEADITFTTMKDDVDFFVPGAPGITNTFRDEVDYVGTVRGRVGTAVNNAVIYFTGGLGFGQIDHQIEQRATGLAPSNAEDASSGLGYALGGGGEMHLGTVMGLPMSAKVEYLYIDLEDSTLTSAGGPAFAPSTTNYSNQLNQVRVGVNVQLGGM